METRATRKKVNASPSYPIIMGDLPKRVQDAIWEGNYNIRKYKCDPYAAERADRAMSKAFGYAQWEV